MTRGRSAAIALILIATAVTYWGSFSGALIFDDRTAITENNSIHTLWPPAQAFSPPPTAGTGGRPFANLTFALNYAISGDNLWSYHALNLAIHTFAALMLFGVVRRTLSSPALRSTFVPHELPLATAVAVLWALHPVQTQAVTYLSQRTEELMGLCYLATLYMFIRGAESASRTWLALAVATCLCGMASKEVMVTAPLMVLLYDRTFIAGTFRAAWQQRRECYLALGGTWLALLVLTRDLHLRSVGYGLGVSWFDYALTETRSVMLYLKLAFWPHPLIFDYGGDLVRDWTEVLWPAALLFTLLAGTLVSLRRWPAVGFAACWFFVILAPASSVVPIVEQPMAESRMYLSVAAPLTLLVLHLHLLVRRHALIAILILASGFGLLSAARNRVYRSESSLWADTASHVPRNARAHYNLGLALDKADAKVAAIAEYREALRLNPDHAKAHTNLGRLLDNQGETLEAIAHLQRAILLQPDLVEAYVDLGLTHLSADQPAEAVRDLQHALRLKPDSLEAHLNLSVAWERLGRMADAITTLQEAVRLAPSSGHGHFQLGYSLLRANRTTEAVTEFRQVLQLDPSHVDAHFSLGAAFFRLQRWEEAQAEFEAALRLKPESAEIHNNLATVLMQRGQLLDARRHLQLAVEKSPNYVEARYNLGTTLLKLGQWSEARTEFEAGVKLDPNNAEMHNNLGFVLSQLGNLTEAITHFERAVQLKPNYEDAQKNLAAARARFDPLRGKN